MRNGAGQQRHAFAAAHHLDERRERGRADGPAQTGEPLYAGIESHGVSGSFAPTRYAEDDDFAQAGALYRLIDADARERLVRNLAGSLAQVAHEGIVARSIAHFRNADPVYGARVEAALKERKR